MPPMLVKLQRKGQMVIPRSLREEAGVAEGTLMKVAVVKGGQFLITPQISIDRAIVIQKSKNLDQTFDELRQVVAGIRQEAKEKGVDKMSAKDINRAVAATRRDMKKTSKKPSR